MKDSGSILFMLGSTPWQQHLIHNLRLDFPKADTFEHRKMVKIKTIGSRSSQLGLIPWQQNPHNSSALHEFLRPRLEDCLRNDGMKAAHNLFGKMPEQNKNSWTVMSDANKTKSEQDNRISVWKVSRSAENLFRFVDTLLTIKNYLETFIKQRQQHSWDETLEVWRVAELTCLESIKSHDDAIFEIDTKKRIVYSVSVVGTIKALSKKGTCCHSWKWILEGRKYVSMNSVVVSDDGKWIYGGGSDGLEMENEGNFELVSWKLGCEIKKNEMVLLRLCLVGKLLYSGYTHKSSDAWKREAHGKISRIVMKDENSFMFSKNKFHDGSCKKMVTTIGMRTQWGKLMAALSEGGDDGIPLQVKLKGVATGIGKRGILFAVVTLAVLVQGLLRHNLAFTCVLMIDFLSALVENLNCNITTYTNYYRVYVPQRVPIKSDANEALRIKILFQQMQNMPSNEKHNCDY